MNHDKDSGFIDEKIKEKILKVSIIKPFHTSGEKRIF